MTTHQEQPLTSPLIEPSRFDAVAVTSGLTEVLIASALARAGKSVLVLDPGDTYGDSWAGVSGDQLQRCAGVGSRAAADQAGADAGAGASATAAAAAAGCRPLTNDDSAVTFSLNKPHLSSFSGAAAHHRLRLWPGGAEALAHRTTLIDRAPKVLYQAEPIVDALVAVGAHHYLDFRLLDGSYMYRSGTLHPVPASRAELFADRSLSLADKRALGRFLAACADAQQGVGRLHDAFDDRPLVQLLCEEGLPPELQDVVLYGIAQADVQQQQDQQQSECSRFVVTASHGLSLLSLYAASLGRYGGRSAFMLPAYGTGSLPEAFVRLAAVRGAVTALRYEAACVALPQTSHPAAAAATATATSLQATEQSIDSSGTVPDASLCDASVTLCNGQMLAAGAVLASVHAAPPSLLQHCHAWPRVARCAALLDGSVVPGDDALLLVFPPGTLPGVAAPVVVRGLQLAHTHGVTPPGMCLLHLAAVIPDSNREGWLSPNSVSGSVSAAAAEQGQAAHASIAPAAAAACAAVSVAAEAQLAELVLRPALEALALLDDTMTCEKQQQQQQQQQQQRPRVLAACYSLARQPLREQLGCTLQQQHCSSSGHEGDCLRSGSDSGQQLLWCDPAPVGFTGVAATLAAAEAAFRDAFPGLPWLTEPVPTVPTPTNSGRVMTAADGVVPQGPADAVGTVSTGGTVSALDEAAAAPPGGGGECSQQDADGGASSARDGGGLLDDAELDAIDQLAAALSALTAAPAPDMSPMS